MADVQADLSLRWAHIPLLWCCHVAAQILDSCIYNPFTVPVVLHIENGERHTHGQTDRDRERQKGREYKSPFDAELNDLKNIIFLGKSEGFFERVSVCTVTEKLMEHGIRYLPGSDTIDYTDDKVMSSRHHSAKVLSTAVGNSIGAIVTDL